MGPADPSRLRGRPTALPMRSADARGRIHHAGAGDSQDSGPRRPALRAASSSRPRAATLPGILIGPISRLRFAIEGPEVGRFDVRRVGVALVVRAGFVDHAGLGASILASKSRGKVFRGAKCPRSRPTGREGRSGRKRSGALDRESRSGPG